MSGNGLPTALQRLMPGPAPVMTQQVDPITIFAAHTGLSPMQLSGLKAAMEPCLCGCQGTRIVLNLALHALRDGRPEFFDRDALRVKERAAPKPAADEEAAT